ncbi:carboxymuconolactone decarboxylase family protein [Nitriliruptor alkaliphilus]|uniref:carboxymuconolactone decarboxylase family protein n=1 Tax=Nitriliruptor alkaliphilus TaxID=427918 RepID=UPI000697911C|nr:carboxymuconolactone decarboxylase family protein [Nitriliruptor alkaliphilus]
MSFPTFTRVAVLLLAVSQLLTGLWAVLAPRGFYDRFPGLGAPWVAVDGPYNAHLVGDAGAGFLATGVALLIAGVWLHRPVVLVALAAYLAHGVPHAAYHLRAPAPALALADQIASTVPLVLSVLVAAGLLIAWLRTDAPRRLPAGTADGSAEVTVVAGRPRDPLLAVAFAVARRRTGAVPTSWRVLARVPRLARAHILGDAAHQTTRTVPAELGALATLRAATLVECAFCIDILSAAAWHEGVSEEQVHALGRWRDSEVFDADERLVLTLTDALTDTPAVVDGALREQLIDRFGEEGLIELASTIAHENARARANRALGVAPQGFATAAGCPLPLPASA